MKQAIKINKADTVLAEPILLEAKDISLRRYGRSVLKKVSLEIKEGDFVTIIGPNGAGKSTLLSCLMGLLRPHEGKIIRSPKLKIAYVPQRLHLENSMPIDVKSFIKLGRNMTTESKAYSDFILKQTEIERLWSRQLNRLSFGELQRVFLARALLQEPNLLVLDEPMQNLDVSGELKLYKLLGDLYQQRRRAVHEKHVRGPLSVLMVSHELHMVMAVTTKVFCLFHHVCCSGTPKEVAQNAAFKEVYGDDMVKLMKVYSHAHNHIHQADEESTRA